MRPRSSPLVMASASAKCSTLLPASTRSTNVRTDSSYSSESSRSLRFHLRLPGFQSDHLTATATVTSMRKPMFESTRCLYPPLDEQERIVAILDKFDALVNDLSIGLPAELNARRQQYEYYRDRLLTFSEARMSEAPAAPRYEPISVGDESTVVAEFVPDASRETAYQSEAELEAAFIELLQSQAYEYLRDPERVRAGRQPARAARGAERDRVHRRRVGSGSSPRRSRARTRGSSRRRRGSRRTTSRCSQRDDGTIKNVLLIDKRNIHNNRLQVINQYEVDVDAASRANRYDVTILVNGLPLVHVELKRRGVDDPRGVQPDQPLPARQLLGRLGAVRVRAALRDQQRHAHEVLLEHDPRRQHVAEQAGGAAQAADVEQLRVHVAGGRTRRTGRSPT